MSIKFNVPPFSQKSLDYLLAAVKSGQLSGEGPYNIKCSQWLEDYLSCPAAILTPSCTSALEMASTLIGIQPGDEVIMPAFTFPSTPNAFVLRGAVPVFVDIEETTFNIDISKLESAISNKTRAIVPVHYAGVSCDMERLVEFASKHKLIIIEDAAQALFSHYKTEPVGSYGHFSTFSFHETKNLGCGEGGVLIINDSDYIDSAHIYKDKGTNRTAFFEGKVDKYTWQDVGSSIKISELQAAYLLGQLEDGLEITEKRHIIWNKYMQDLMQLEENACLRLPKIPTEVKHNSHIFPILLNSLKDRIQLVEHLDKHNISAYTHFEPLHLSQAGEYYGREGTSLEVTEDIVNRLLRLPLYSDMEIEKVDTVISEIKNFYS